MSSFVPVPQQSDFPVNNLPYGACNLPSNSSSKARLCVAIGDHVVDLGQLQQAGCFTGPILSRHSSCFLQVAVLASGLTVSVGAA